MPTDILSITVLLASPGDVDRERGMVRKAVEEVNLNTGEAEGFHIVVKGWETHSRPAGGRAQGNITRQIGPTDIFLGIMWARLGSPTGKASSGTVEEYEDAIRIRKRSRRALKPSVMFYFKTKSPRNLRDLDPDQLAAVRAFKARVFKENLAAEFETAPQLERMVRRHLTAEAREIARAHRGKGGTRTPARSTSTKPTPKARQTTPPPARATPRKKARKPTPRQFAHIAFRSVRTRFERLAKAESQKRPHVHIAIQRDGDAAFTAVATSYGNVVTHARIAADKDGARWSLIYQRGETHSFYGAEPGFRTELRVHVADLDGARGFERTARQSWTVPDGLDQSPEVAQAFWDRLTQGVL